MVHNQVSVSDEIGKEDLLLHLKMLSLQKLAPENEYNRLVVGSCTSRLASHGLAATVKEENPSRECKIVRTAAKLTPFYFNKIPETDDSCVPMAIQRRLKKLNLKYDGSMTTNALCPICNNPLNGSDSLEECHESKPFMLLAVQVTGSKYFHKIDHPLSISAPYYHI
ncbi:Cytoplasmic tRNA 2-thiolation protein 2 [Raphanus sativus]|nr:Cytoplasmic tRNA 2-thiolation protein 2 [Raphanus sativus]